MLVDAGRRLRLRVEGAAALDDFSYTVERGILTHLHIGGVPWRHSATGRMYMLHIGKYLSATKCC